MTQTVGQRSKVMRSSSPHGDEHTWLIPCFQEKPLSGFVGVRTVN